MTPPETDIALGSLGPCPVCGEERLRVKRLVYGSASGLRLRYEVWIMCGCGERKEPD